MLDHVISELLESAERQSIDASFVTARKERGIGLVSSILDTVVVPDVLAEMIFALEAIAASVTARGIGVSFASSRFRCVNKLSLQHEMKNGVTTYLRQWGHGWRGTLAL